MNNPSKGVIATIIATMLIVAAPLSWAGDRGHGYKHGHRHGGWAAPRHVHNHYYGYRAPYYGHYRNNNDNDEVLYLVGGLLLGGALTHVYHTSQQRAYAAPTPAYATYSAPSPSRRLVRDAAGNCYESYFDASGAEIRVPVSPSQCYW
jgi:hypothetical protein